MYKKTHVHLSTKTYTKETNDSTVDSDLLTSLQTCFITPEVLITTDNIRIPVDTYCLIPNKLSLPPYFIKFAVENVLMMKNPVL